MIDAHCIYHAYRQCLVLCVCALCDYVIHNYYASEKVYNFESIEGILPRFRDYVIWNALK